MATHPEAMAAIEALDGKFVWEGMDCPMVVKVRAWAGVAVSVHMHATREAGALIRGTGKLVPVW